MSQVDRFVVKMGLNLSAVRFDFPFVVFLSVVLITFTYFQLPLRLKGATQIKLASRDGLSEFQQRDCSSSLDPCDDFGHKVVKDL